MRRLLLSIALTAVTAPAIAETPLPVLTGGRVIEEPGGGARFGWPGVYFEGRFRGDSVRARFEAPAEFMRLLVDGEEKAVVKRAPEADILLDGLSDGDHVVRLEKMTESQTGGGRFLGFFVPGDGDALPVQPRMHQIEFIGDSYTVGYGNTSPVRECTGAEVHDRTDTQQAFGPIVARHFDADYRVNAYSGFGIVRNYDGGSRGLSLPVIYSRLKPDEAAQTEGADPDWHPQLIVINLGTNDFSTPLNPGEPWETEEALKADYRDTYVSFVQTLRRRQPQAHFILMGSDDFFPEVQKVADRINRDSAGRAIPVRFGGLDLQGCDWHPSLADDRRLADLLIQTIDALPDGF